MLLTTCEISRDPEIHKHQITSAKLLSVLREYQMPRKRKRVTTNTERANPANKMAMGPDKWLSGTHR